MKSNISEKSIQEAIIDLYLNIKIRKQDELDRFEKNSLERDKEKLLKTNPMLILDYIKSSVEILINMKVQEKLESVAQSRNSEELSEAEMNCYEKELRHLEAEIRTHIKIEHQLKLHNETMQNRIDELEFLKEDQKQKLKNLQEHINNSRQSGDFDFVENLKNENINLKQIIKSYEERNISITELERKIREKQAKHEKELKDLESKYKDKLRILNKKIKNDDNSKNSALLTKENRITELTVESHQLTDRVLVRNTSNLGITDRKRDENLTNTSNLGITDRRRDEYSTNTSNLGITDRKRDEYSTNINEKKKSETCKKLSENMKNIIDDLKNKKDCSFLAKKKVDKEVNEDLSMNCSSIKNKEKNIKNEFSKSHHRTDSLVKLNENSSSKLNLSKSNNNKHTRNCSLEKPKQHTHNENQANNNIHGMKDLVSTNKFKSNNSQKQKPIPQILTPSRIGNNTINNNTNYIPSGNGIVNQNAVPCFNNINIYTSNMNNFKTNEINLKQYIVNKMNTKSKNNKQNHSKTSSITANH